MHLLRYPFGTCKGRILPAQPDSAKDGRPLPIPNNDNRIQDAPVGTNSVLNEASTGSFALGLSYLERLDYLVDKNSEETKHNSLQMEVERFLSANLSGKLLDAMLSGLC